MFRDSTLNRVTRHRNRAGHLVFTVTMSEMENPMLHHTATYSPEDNKLRIYPAHRLDDELGDEYDDFKAAGYRWAAKQECFVCARWTPTAEDWALRLLDGADIEDEDYSMLDRSADRAERFSGYRDKRAGEAGVNADTFEDGPSVFGNQSQARAEKQAARHDRHRVNAVSCWSKAEYWQRRTSGVISHALHRANPAVRRERIKRLEAEQRKHEKERSEAIAHYEGWLSLLTMDGSDEVLPEDPSRDNCNPAQRTAYMLSNYGSRYAFWHPDSEEANERAKQIWGHGFSTYDLLTDTNFGNCQFRQLSPREVAQLVIEHTADPRDDSTRWGRWSAHYELRLTYERAMLENEGGAATNAEMVPGGWIQWRGRWPIPGGRYQIAKVNKNRSGGVSSVMVEAPTHNPYDSKGNAWGPDNPRHLVLHKVDVTRLPEDAYTPPTDEDLAAFKQQQKTSKPKTCPLINPTIKDAKQLQAIWNGNSEKPAEITEMTQAQYSRMSKTDVVGTVGCHEDGKQRHDGTKGRAFKVRRRWLMYGPDSVIVITDKPQRSLPLAVEV